MPALTRYFTGGSGEVYRELEAYQPARALVRLINHQISDAVVQGRYGAVEAIAWEDIVECLREQVRYRLAAKAARSSVRIRDMRARLDQIVEARLAPNREPAKVGA